ncbi:MAG TPA: DUF5916 domain-containing protein [Longimicrobiales bacterium]
MSIQHRFSRVALVAALIFVLPAAARAQTLAGGNATPVAYDGAAGPVVTPPSDSPEHDTLAPRAQAARISGGIEIDGVLDEAAWAGLTPITTFTQSDPTEGQPATQRTEVRIAYDDEAIYIGARMYDDQPQSIVGRLARRDADTGSDFILISFDPFHNHNGDASFSLNPSGTRWDGVNGDVSANLVWEGETTIDEQGWTAEMRIPFSQLRFNPGSTEDWGLQVERFTNRLNERVTWSYWTRQDQGGPSRWGHLDGMATPSSVPGRLELLPYVASVAQLHGRINTADPFAEESEAQFRAGMDLKYQVTSNLTLSATVNPDFGQAEVDPAVVNLSAFETVFEEKREFFIEGRDKLGFGSLWCFTCSNTSSLSMLYTRRIGRSPQVVSNAYAAGDSVFVDAPEATTILGAAKLTGRTAGGWNVGLLDAYTARENADVWSENDVFEREVEPATNYFVGRVSREMQDGNLEVGGIFTSVVRNFEDDALRSRLNAHSEGLGFDGEYWWNNRNYHWLGQVAFTQITGDTAAIRRRQQTSARYFQRPDRDHGSNGLFTDRFDPNLTQMRGYGLYTRVAKEGGQWRWEAATNVRSPGFENNDIAALSRTDFIFFHGSLNRRLTEPTSWYRQGGMTMGAQQELNFDGDITQRQVSLSGWVQLHNFWETGLFTFVRPETMDDRATWGGPVVGNAREYVANAWINTNYNKPIVFGLTGEYFWSEDGTVSRYAGLDVTWKPVSNVSLSLGPSWNGYDGTGQFVTSVADATATDFYGARYVFSDISQQTVSMNTRLNVTFTPTMSLELFAQPFIASNDFGNYKEYDQPRDWQRTSYDDVAFTDLEDGSREVTIDPDGAAGPAESFSFIEPDFVARSLRGNAVFRWEYVPGSTLFLVWTQDRYTQENVGELDFDRDHRALGAAGEHVFLVKLNYWLPL